MGIEQEFRGVELGDKRLNDRVVTIAQALMEAPGESFPKQLKTEAGVEGLYRLLSHPSANLGPLLSPHVAETAGRVLERCQAGQTVLVAHDTTTVTMSTSRAGLGRVQQEGNQSFFLHTGLAVALREDGTQVPLGVLHAEPYIREGVPNRKRKKGHHSERRKAPSRRESARWFRGARQAQQALLEGASVVHVADREADQYTLLSQLCADEARFVVRAKHERSGLVRLDAGAELAPVLRTVEVGERGPRRKGKHFSKGARKARKAEVELCGCGYQLTRPTTDAKRREAPAPQLTLNQVRVQEVNPPEGVEPVDWTLWTSENINSSEQLEWVVDCYRARWMVEEFFKALKTGCAYQSRQLESKETLFAALGFLLPVAWRLLALKHLAEADPDAPVNEVLTDAQQNVLQRHQATAKLPLRTAIDALMAVARLGGHLKRNGPPGWQVVSRGFLELLSLERGFLLNQNGPSCDLS